VTSTFGGRAARVVTLSQQYEAIYDMWLRPVYDKSRIWKLDSPVDGLSHIWLSPIETKRLASCPGAGKSFKEREQGALGSIEVTDIVPQCVIGIQANEIDGHYLPQQRAQRFCTIYAAQMSIATHSLCVAGA